MSISRTMLGLALLGGTAACDGGAPVERTPASEDAEVAKASNVELESEPPLPRTKAEAHAYHRRHPRPPAPTGAEMHDAHRGKPPPPTAAEVHAGHENNKAKGY